MNKTFWAVIGIIVIIFGGIIVNNSRKESTTTTNTPPTNHVTGGGSSGVKLIEYADFECSVCGQYYPIVKQVTAKYKDQIYFQVRHLPLLQIHRHAFAGARAAEAASRQDKFWEMYDLLFQNQSIWAGSDNPEPFFEQYAKQLNLDVAKFKRDTASSDVNNSVNADLAEFKKTKLTPSTPTFFLDGKQIKPRSVDEFNKLIDAAIAAHKQ